MSSNLDSQSPAERLYFDFAAKRDRGDAVAADFERLCAKHPEHGAELRRLRQLEGFAEELLQNESNFFRPDSAPLVDAARGADGLARSFQPGETIGDFTLVRFIGHGGMGQVWEARQNSMRRPVALKFLLPGRADERMIALFEREARAGGRANHPNLVRTLARGKTDGIEWIAQELVAGSYSLRDAIERFRREPMLPKNYYRRCASLVQAIAQGVQAAHAAGVIHRDLKPQNSLIDSRDTPRVADFGLARGAGDSVLSNTGEFAGTYHYMSPEQVMAKRMGLDHRTDIFSLGVVMYELLTLSRPFDGDTTQKIAEAIVTVDPPDPSKIRAQCPRDLAVICAKAMQKRPSARYGSMKEFAEDIGRYLKNEPILARPATQLEKTRKWVLRHPAASVGIGVGAVALVVISGVAIYAIGQADRAERGEAAAQRSAEEATQRANDVLSLSAQKEYDDLVAQAGKLWPASTEMIPRYEEWLRKARELVDGRPADEAKGLKKRPSLAEHKAKLAELRQDALPLTEEQIRADRETHPKFAEWQTKSADLLWRSRMLGMESWPDAAAAEAELASEKLPGDAGGLNRLAWKLVDPKQPVFGQEVRALLMAKRALAAAKPIAGASGTASGTDGKSGLAASGDGSGSASATGASLAGIRYTLAWAFYRNGEFEAALAEMKTALIEPGGDELKQSGKDLEKAVLQWQGEEVAKRRERRDALATEVAALGTQINERRTFDYANDEKDWWDRRLRVLVGNIESFADPKSGLLGSGVNSEFGWGVQKRYDFAKSVRERTITGAEAKRRWDEAILAIAKSEKYRDTVFPGGGLLTPQEGLLPLGADPQSGLWEFWHVQSGDEPERDKDGNFVRQKSGAHKLIEKGENGTGIVLVLIPGGTFWMGSQKTDPTGQNYDPGAFDRESPVHRVSLSPYFLSKYEMTQGQWVRFTGLNPSGYDSGWNGTVGITNPVEQVNWTACERVTRNLGLELPSEAQWEFGARGGTSSVWWTGNAKESLADKVNLADQSFVAVGGPPGVAAWWPEFRDGFPVHAPVGVLAANAFGLHEVCGNVWEWCFDVHADYLSEETRDPRTDGDGLAWRVSRGGGFGHAATDARSALIDLNAPTSQQYDLGVRPSRALQLSPAPLHPPK